MARSQIEKPSTEGRSCRPLAEQFPARLEAGAPVRALTADRRLPGEAALARWRETQPVFDTRVRRVLAARGQHEAEPDRGTEVALPEMPVQRRLQTLALNEAYGDFSLVESLHRSSAATARALGDALFDSAPDWSLLRRLARRGEVAGGRDITDALREAALAALADKAAVTSGAALTMLALARACPTREALAGALRDYVRAAGTEPDASAAELLELVAARAETPRPGSTRGRSVEAPAGEPGPAGRRR
jgi:hypothetical protein